MKVTKYEHAFMVLEQNGQQLVIDPGMFSASLPILPNVAGIIITHEHSDHYKIENLNSILQAHPGVPLYAPQDVIDQLPELNALSNVASPGKNAVIGQFNVDFVGGEHAVIYQTSPCNNVGILVNRSFYYPGDSLDLPSEPISLLAVPASAPWLKTSEAMNFIASAKASHVFPVHDALLSKIGQSVTYNWLERAAKEAGSTWQMLEAGQSIDT